MSSFSQTDTKAAQCQRVVSGGNVHHKQRTDMSQVWNFLQLWDPLDFNSFLTFLGAGVLWHPKMAGSRLVEERGYSSLCASHSKNGFAQLSSAGGGATPWAALQLCRRRKRISSTQVPNFHRKWLKFLQELDSPFLACAVPGSPQKMCTLCCSNLCLQEKSQDHEGRLLLFPKKTPLALLLSLFLVLDLTWIIPLACRYEQYRSSDRRLKNSSEPEIC